ncbi:hypothetical protein J7M00_03390 [bacterium]|nr:hypothetical protein [bacterium]
MPLRKMSIVKSAFFAVIKVFWKGIWGKASFPKEAFRFTIQPSDCDGSLPYWSLKSCLSERLNDRSVITGFGIKYYSSLALRKNSAASSGGVGFM